VAIQLNDTHPAIAVAELMRILIDDARASTGSEAWEITRGTFSYTNHTLLPEALESWPVPLFERLLPRHMQIIYADQRRGAADARKRPASASADRSHRFADRRERRAARAHGQAGLRRLAFGQRRLGAAYRADEADVFADLHRSTPERINNKTNGITPRRWLMQCNPGLTRKSRGDRLRSSWTATSSCRRSRPVADRPRLPRRSGGQARQQGALANSSPQRHGHRVDPDAMFDVQIKRIHEYKRQLLNIIEAIALYDQIRAAPRARLGAARQDLRRQGRAGYHNAKLIIKLPTTWPRSSTTTRGRATC
jgi:glycogen phosphorylase